MVLVDWGAANVHSEMVNLMEDTCDTTHDIYFSSVQWLSLSFGLSLSVSF